MGAVALLWLGVTAVGFLLYFKIQAVLTRAKLPELTVASLESVLPGCTPGLRCSIF